MAINMMGITGDTANPKMLQEIFKMRRFALPSPANIVPASD